MARKSERKNTQRLNRGYRPHVEQIAALYVACGENAVETAEQVRELIPELKKFRDATLSRWRDAPEWKVALEAAREEKKFDDELEARRRGRDFLRWATARMHALKRDHEAACGEKDKENEVAKLDGRILKINDAMRIEERYLEEMKRKTGAKASEASLIVRFEGREDGTS